MKAVIVAILPKSAEQIGAAFPKGIAAELFDAGAQDALCSLIASQAKSAIGTQKLPQISPPAFFSE